MYFSYPCPACGRLFFINSSHQPTAARLLYAAIRKHLEDYNEDYREYDMDDGAEEDSRQIEAGMKASSTAPEKGWYEIRS